MCDKLTPFLINYVEEVKEMRLITRSFDNMPPEAQGYTVYVISTTKPQR